LQKDESVNQSVNRQATEDSPETTQGRYSEEYGRALESSNAAVREFTKAQDDYRARRISDQEFIAARRKNDAAQEVFDAAFVAENKRAAAKEKAARDAKGGPQLAEMPPQADATTTEVAAPAKTEKAQALAASLTDAAAHEAATSPTNDRQEPTGPQAIAGNYKKGHLAIGPLRISIENPEGSTRSDKENTTPKWSRTIERAHYGYIRGTLGRDKDHIDAFVKPGTSEQHDGPVFVIDQIGKDGKFDEHKVMLGYASQVEAVGAYRANYPKDHKVGKVTQTVMADFDSWARDTHLTSKPYSDAAEARAAAGTDLGAPTIAVKTKAVPKPAAEKPAANGSAPAQTEAAPEKTAPAVVGRVSSKPGQEPAAESPQHVDDGKIEEASPEIIRESIIESARNTPMDLREAKAALIAKVNDVIASAPKHEDVVGTSAPAEYVRFNVEGDGAFKVRSTKENLTAFRDKLQQSMAGWKPEPKAGRHTSVLEKRPKQAAPSVDLVKELWADKEYNTLLSLIENSGEALRFGNNAKDTPAVYFPSTLTKVGGRDAFVGKLLSNKATSWYVIDMETGLSIGDAKTESEALRVANDRVAKLGKGALTEAANKVEKVSQDALRARFVEWAKTNAVEHDRPESESMDAAPAELPAGETVAAPDRRAEEKAETFADVVRQTEASKSAEENRPIVIPEGYKPAGEPYHDKNQNLVQPYARFEVGERVRLREAGIEGAVEELVGPSDDGIFRRFVVAFPLGRQTIDENAIDTASPGVVEQAASLTQAPAPVDTKIETVGGGESIADFGEKIGGARKDTAKPLGRRTRIEKALDDRPAWVRKYVATEKLIRVSDRELKPTGKWELMKLHSGGSGAMTRVSRQTFDTEADALAAIPLAEVSRNHRAYAYKGEGGAEVYGIFRQITDRKRALVKGGFATLDAAKLEMATNPAPIIEHKFQFPEKPWLDHIDRAGQDRRKGDVTTKMFQDTFGFRGGEFGNWNMGSDGQAALNHAYDALLDLADTIGVPPKALSLNGELAIAFGARGTGGEGSARAHYEPDAVVINLTKIRGAGSLAHEWFHALDDYIARSSDTEATARSRKMFGDQRMATHRLTGNVRPELKATFDAVVSAMTTKKGGVAIEEEGAKRGLTRAQEAVQSRLDNERRTIATARQWGAKKGSATTAQLAEWDALAARAVAGDNGAKVHVSPPKVARLAIGYQSSEVVRGLNAIYKAVTGRSFDTADSASMGRQLYWAINSVADMNERVAKAQEGAIEERRTGTEFFNEAKKIDGYRASDYWATPHEMGARAFESYIFDKLAANENRSDYLVHGVENRYYALLQMKPYPEGAERTAINDAFDNLFRVIQTRDTDRGVEFYSLDRRDAEFARTERAYGGREAYDKAKAAGRTKLNYRQWVQVRTAAFKRWFGYWEAESHQHFLNGEPVARMRGDEVPANLGKMRELAEWVSRDWQDRFGGKAINPQLGVVALDKRAASSSAGHGMSAMKQQAFYLAPDIVEKGRVIGQLEKSDPTKPDAFLIAAPVRIGDQDYYGLVEVRRDANMQRMYVHEAVLRTQKAPVNVQVAAASQEGAEPRAVNTGAIARLLHDTLSVNPDAVSKVVDAKTGEPLVVYHGTNADFVAFDNNRLGESSAHKSAKLGSFFSASPRVAEAFAGERWEGWPLKRVLASGANTMSALINIRNPIELSAAEFVARFVRGNESAQAFRGRAEADGFDGAVVRGDANLSEAIGGEEYGADAWVAFRPTQIKSAIGNSGAFDPTNQSTIAALDRGSMNRIERALDAGDAAVVRAEIVRSMAAKREVAGPNRGVISARKAILDARRSGAMDKATADLTLWLLSKAPHLANDAAIVVPQGGREGTAGNYNPVERLITLVANRGDETTGVHEFMHHAERLMSESAQKGIREEWARRLSDLQSWGQSVDSAAARRAVGHILRMNAGDREAQQAFNSMIRDGALPWSAYQMANPSEFWAENAARVLADRAYAEQHGWVAEARQWLRELVEKIKDILGLQSDAVVLRALREVINGNGDALSSAMLLEDDNATGMRATRDRVFPKIEFDAIDRPMGRALNNIHLPRPEEARNAIASATKANRPAMLGALTRRQMAEVYGQQAPELREYDQAMQNMEAEYQRSARASDVVLRQWTKLKPAIADRMAEVMHAATLADYDPAQMVGKQVPAGPLRALQAQYDSMPADAKAVYAAARDHYQTMLDDRFDALRQRIMRSEAGPQAKASAIDRLAAMYDQAKQGVYFPLARFGDHLVLATKKDTDGKEVGRQMSAFESAFKADTAARQLRADGWTVKQMRAKEYSRDQQGAASKIVGDMMAAIDGLNFGEGENSLGEGVGSAKDQLLDALNQSFIGSLPDLSYRKHFAHRQGVAGFSRDAMRAFADSAFHAAHNISRLRHGDTLSFALMGLDKRIRQAEGVDTTVLGDAYNEMVKRHAIYMNPNTSPVAAWLGQLGFVMSLGGSVATGVTNMTQVPLITLPWLRARHGLGKSAAALTRAYKDFADPATLNAETVFNAVNSKRLTEAERAMMQSLIDDGVIDVTQALDLAQLSSTDATSRFAKEYGGVKDRVMRALAFTFHVPEVANRQVTALAAYRLAIDARKTDAEAREFAKEAVWGTHFDYSSSNRARYMTGNVMRVLTMFKQYGQNVLYLYGRSLKVWLDRNNATQEERAIARRQFLGLLGFQFAAAGALGMPILGSVATIFAAALKGLGGDDDDWEWEVEFRKWLAEAIGKDAAEVASHGLSRLTPWDMSGRLGQNDLFIRTPSREREGRAAFLDWLTAIGGPVAGYAQNAYLGLGDIMTGVHQGSGGHLLRGAEELTPAFARNAIKAMRFQIEGGVLTRDQTKQLELTAPEKFGQLFGFGPSRSAEMYESVTAIKNAKARLNQRRQGILDSYARALKEHNERGLADMRREIFTFNQQHPQVAITAQAMRASIFMRAKREREMRDGVWLSKSRDHLRSEGAFANMH